MTISLSRQWLRILIFNDRMFIHLIVLTVLSVLAFQGQEGEVMTWYAFFLLYAAFVTWQVATLHHRSSSAYLIKGSSLSVVQIVKGQMVLSLVINAPVFLISSIYLVISIGFIPWTNAMLISVIGMLFAISVSLMLSSIFRHYTASLASIFGVFFMLSLLPWNFSELIHYLSPMIPLYNSYQLDYFQLMGLLIHCLAFVGIALMAMSRRSDFVLRKKILIINLPVLFLAGSFYLYDMISSQKIESAQYAEYIHEGNTIRYKGISQEEAQKFAIVHETLIRTAQRYGFQPPKFQLEIEKRRSYSFIMKEQPANLRGKTIQIRLSSEKELNFAYTDWTKILFPYVISEAEHPTSKLQQRMLTWLKRDVRLHILSDDDKQLIYPERFRQSSLEKLNSARDINSEWNKSMQDISTHCAPKFREIFARLNDKDSESSVIQGCENVSSYNNQAIPEH